MDKIASTARVVSTPDWAAALVDGSQFMAEYTAHYNVLHTDCWMRERPPTSMTLTMESLEPS